MLEALPAHLRGELLSAKASRQKHQRGRFAPTPSGPLHLGNLHTALLSWLFSRLQGGEWFIRIDDLDTPRIQSGAEAQIFADLAWLGLDWDPPAVAFIKASTWINRPSPVGSGKVGKHAPATPTWVNHICAPQSRKHTGIKPSSLTLAPNGGIPIEAKPG